MTIPTSASADDGRTQRRDAAKTPLSEQVRAGRIPAWRAYAEFFVGRGGIGALIAYELITGLCGGWPGALGLWLRKMLYPRLCRRVGAGVLWGRNITLRHPGELEVGERTAIDDDCLLDAKGAGGVRIGRDVMIARQTVVQAKAGPVVIGDGCIVGSQCQLTSVGGITIGASVMIAGQCYLGGGRYHTDDPSTPMKDQGLYSNGPIVIEDDVWLGAGVVVQDGVRLGKGSVIGAGAVVREDVPAGTVVVPHQRTVLLPRSAV